METTNECDILDGKKVKITYPVKWGYKVIGKDILIIEQDLKKILKNKDYTIKQSNVSKSKKYISINLTVLILSENERLSIFEILKNTESINYVL